MHAIAIIIWSIGVIAFSAKGGLMGLLFITPFAFFPHLINHYMVAKRKALAAKALSMLSMLSYAGWVAYVYYDVFFKSIDAQGAVAFVFVGIYAMPFLSVLWMIAYLIDRRPAQQGDAPEPATNADPASRPPSAPAR